MAGQNNLEYEISRKDTPPQRDELHRGLGLLRVGIVLTVLTWVIWFGFSVLSSAFLSPIAGAWSIDWGLQIIFSVFSFAVIMLISLALHRCIRSVGLSSVRFSVRLLWIVLIIWLASEILDIIICLDGFVSGGKWFTTNLGPYLQYLFLPYSKIIIGFLFVLICSGLARELNSRFGDRLLGPPQLMFMVSCGIFVWIANSGVLYLLSGIIMNLGFGLWLSWGIRIVTLLLSSFALFWIWRAISQVQVRILIDDFCLNCGYDLTANISGKCPECGQVSSRGEARVWSGQPDPAGSRRSTCND